MSAIIRNVMFPAWHWAKRDNVNRAVRELQRNQWLSTASLLELQQRKLATLLAHARRSVPYYRILLDRPGVRLEPFLSRQALELLPSLTKQIIRDAREQLVSDNLEGNALFSNSTSGSTGEALRFYTDARSSAYRRAAELRSDSFTGWKLGDRTVSLWGAPMDQTRATSLRGRLHGWVTQRLFLSSYELSATRMDEYVQRIREFRPMLLVGYPGPLEQFAIHCRTRGVVFSSITAIVSSAEMLWPAQRELIEKTFAVQIFDRYGCREVGQIASECEAHDGQHISTDRLLVEVVNERGQPCEPGEVGKILITDLDNFGMPLIRYDIGDQGILAQDSPCPCGRGLPKLKRIEGRTMEVVLTPDGRGIGGTFWTLLLRSRPGLRQVQVVQSTLDGVTINFVRDAEFDTAVLDFFASKIRAYCGQDFGVEFVEKDNIDVTSSGKRRLVISHLATHQSVFKAGLESAVKVNMSIGE